MRLPLFGDAEMIASRPLLAPMSRRTPVRPSKQWYRRLAQRYAPRGARWGVVHLRHYSGEFLVVGQGAPLVLVPGLAGGYKLMGRLLRVLAQQFQVVCFPLRGEHETVPSGQARSMADLADDLADFHDALLLERPAHIGLSFGSAVLLEFAIRHPRQLGPIVLNGLEDRFHGTLSSHVLRVALEQVPLPGDSPLLNQFLRLLFAPGESVGALLDLVACQLWDTDQSVIAHRYSLLQAFDVRGRLGEIRSPTLVVAGADDAIVSSSAQRSLARSIPGCRFACLARSGHLCFLTRPRAFARHVANFLGRVQSVAAA